MEIKNEFALLCMKSLLKQIVAIKDIIRYAEVDLWDFGFGYSFLVEEYFIHLKEYLRLRDLAFGIIDCNDVKLFERD
jgi:hypothetical protein